MILQSKLEKKDTAYNLNACLHTVMFTTPPSLILAVENGGSVNWGNIVS